LNDGLRAATAAGRTSLPIIDVHPRSASGGAERDAGDVSGGLEVSFVMPCLNEAETLEGCIVEAMACIERHGLRGEVVIADNGSTDGSQAIARRCGARVVEVAAKGYGNALMGGIEGAQGRFIIMGDSDLSYDFGEGMRFVERLRAGADLVMGNRFKGGIMPGAMPLKHRYLGNPVLSTLGRIVFRVPVRDFHCGLRAFTKDAYRRMDVRTTGMEFASEVVIKARLKDMRIEEVPVRLRKDGRSRPPHLRSWRDGWRHLRFMLCLSPRWTLFVPGVALFALGLVLGVAVAAGPVTVAGVRLDVHTLVAASLMMIVGYQAAVAGAAMRIYALNEEIGPPSPFLTRMFGVFTLERGVLAGAALTLAGLASTAIPVAAWVRSGFGELNPEVTLRPMLVGALLLALGIETVLMSFVLSMLGIQHKRAA